MNTQYDSSSQKSDLYAVLLSFLAGIVQLFLFFIGILGQVTGLQKIFINYDLYPFAILLSLIISLCFVGIISFFKKNPEYLRQEHSFKLFIWLRNLLFNQTRANSFPLSKRNEKRNLLFFSLLLILSTFIFIISTVSHLTNSNYLFINSNNKSLFQLISFMILWIVTPIILYVWISNEIEKNYQYKPENFIPNLIRSLQSQGFIQIIINKDIPYQNTNHLVSAKIQNNDKYFMVQYDGKKIISELTEEEFKTLLNPQSASTQ